MSSYGNSSSGNTVTAYEMTEQSSYAADASSSAPAATDTGASTDYSTGAEEQTSWASSITSCIDIGNIPEWQRQPPKQRAARSTTQARTDNINRRQAGSSAASAPTVQSGFPEASGITSPSAVYNVTRATRTTTGDMTVPIGTEDPLFGQASPDRSSDIAYGSPGSQIVGYRTARGEAMEMVPVSSRGGHFADTNTIPRSGTTLTYSHRAYEDGDPNDTCTCPETCDECTKSCSGICETCLTGVKRCAMGKEGNDVSRTCRRKTWGIAGALGLVVLASGLAIKYGGNDDSGSNSNSGQ